MSKYTFDNQLPVILLVIRLRSADLKHLITGTGYPNYRVSINVFILGVLFQIVCSSENERCQQAFCMCDKLVIEDIARV